MSVPRCRQFLAALDARDLAGAGDVVDIDRYQENRVGFTRGFVTWNAATRSLQKVWDAIPDLRVDLVEVFGDENTVLARGTAGGTNTGRLYGVSATGRSYRVAFFDSCEFVDGRIVRRVQQADVISQMRQLYGRAFGTVGLLSSIIRIDPTSGPL